jgi:hypothetical protein
MVTYSGKKQDLFLKPVTFCLAGAGFLEIVYDGLLAAYLVI